MNILGLNAFHADSSAALVIDGTLVAAAEEERFRRIKHWAGFPTEAIRYCLAEADIGLSEVDVVAINTDPAAQRWHKLVHVIRHRPSPKLILDRLLNRGKRQSIAEYFAAELPNQTLRARIDHHEHHLCHVASGFYGSGHDRAVCVSVDGFGDFASGVIAMGQRQVDSAIPELQISQRIRFPHSLGIFYQAMTQFLGFEHYGDEYKIMGLAPYGAPNHVEELMELISLATDGQFALNTRYFRHHKHRIAFDWDDGIPRFDRLYDERLSEILGPARKPDEPLEQRHKNLAHSVQKIYELAFFNLLGAAHLQHQCDALTLSGGCAMNSVANGKVTRYTPFKQVYVQPAAGDAGGALGAAWLSARRHEPSAPIAPMTHAFWGPSFRQTEIDALIDQRRTDLPESAFKVQVIADLDDLLARVARRIEQGAVIGWFQGRMEWGPRALGNRSILANPAREDMRDIINLKIKRRESFRPFAPVILRDNVLDWFEQDDDVPFMMKVFQIREDRRAQIPAVTHVDGSGRLQTITADQNPRYHGLIRAFESLSGVPMLLNTSFNENEPVVCRPEEALNCFLRTDMDVLVLGDTLIERH